MLSTVDRRLLTCIDALHDASVDQKNLEYALKTINNSLNADGCHIVHQDNKNPLQNVSIVRSEGPILWNDDLAKRFHGMAFEDPRVLLANQFPGKPISCRAYLTDDEIHSTPVYKELLYFTKAEYTLCVNLPGNNDDVLTGFALFRAPGKQPFDQESCDFLGELVPYLKRLFIIQKKLAALEIERSIAADTLDNIPIGIFVVNSRMDIVLANDSGKEMLYNAEGFCVGSSRLMVYNSSEHARLQHIVSNILGAPPHKPRPAPEPISLTGDGTSIPFSVLVSSLSPASLGLGTSFMRQPMAVLFVTDPLKPQETSSDLLQRMFGLTRREGQVVEQLVMGRSLPETAEILGISDNTARTHVKAVFSKTGTSHQADVVRLVLSSPVWIQKTDSRKKIASRSSKSGHLSQRAKILGILPSNSV